MDTWRVSTVTVTTASVNTGMENMGNMEDVEEDIFTNDNIID